MHSCCYLCSVLGILFHCVVLCIVCKCVLHYCHRVTTQLQVTNISYQSKRAKLQMYICSYCSQWIQNYSPWGGFCSVRTVPSAHRLFPFHSINIFADSNDAACNPPYLKCDTLYDWSVPKGVPWRQDTGAPHRPQTQHNTPVTILLLFLPINWTI
jgi:hypothetical protein